MGWPPQTILAVLACYGPTVLALPSIHASPTVNIALFTVPLTSVSIHTSPASTPTLPTPSSTASFSSPSSLTSFPTTVTTYWTTTVTSLPSPSALAGNASAAAAAAGTWIIAKTVTVIEPWPVSPDPASFPYTMLQTSIVSVSATHYWEGKSSSSLSIPSPEKLPTSTWVIWDTAPADLPVGIVPACGETETEDEGGEVSPTCVADWKPDVRCVAAGLPTRCQSQCIVRDWQWWCLKAGDGDPEHNDPTGTATTSANKSSLPIMGRLCWGNSTNFVQLMEPCDATDYAPKCLPCSLGNGR